MTAHGEEGDATDATDVPEIEHVTGTGIPLRGDDVDTDQIIPARFLKILTFEGLGQFVFFDQRYEGTREVGPEHAGGDATESVEAPTDHPFNDDRYRGASVLVVDANFGCGSSREHAPEALRRWGVDAVVGESFADIFASNCLAIGLPTVTASREAVAALQDHVEANPETEIEVDVAGEEVRYDGTEIDAGVDPSARHSLVEGQWDTTAMLRSNPEEVRAVAASLPYVDAGENRGRQLR